MQKSQKKAHPGTATPRGKGRGEKPGAKGNLSGSPKKGRVCLANQGKGGTSGGRRERGPQSKKKKVRGRLKYMDLKMGALGLCRGEGERYKNRRWGYKKNQGKGDGLLNVRHLVGDTR